MATGIGQSGWAQILRFTQNDKTEGSPGQHVGRWMRKMATSQASLVFLLSC